MTALSMPKAGILIPAGSNLLSDSAMQLAVPKMPVPAVKFQRLTSISLLSALVSFVKNITNRH